MTERELESRPLDCVVPTAGEERVLLHVVVSETDENVRRPVQVPWPVWNRPQYWGLHALPFCPNWPLNLQHSILLLSLAPEEVVFG